MKRCRSGSLNELGRFGGAQHHAEQIARIIRVGHHIEAVKKWRSRQFAPYIAQRGEILCGKTNGVKQCRLALAAPTGSIAENNPPELCDRMILGQLLNFPFDSCLSAVTVVITCAPSTASSALLHGVISKPRPARFLMHFSVARRSISNSLNFFMLRSALKAIA